MKLQVLRKWVLVGGLALFGVAGAAVTAQTAYAHDGRGGGGARGEALAEELGISVAELETAYDTAKDAAVAELVSQGWISDEEAADFLENRGRLPFMRGAYYEPLVDEKALLADALGISVDELEAAMAAVGQARVDALLESGAVTEAQVADRSVVRDFKQSLNKNLLLAEALGVSEADLDAARADNKRFDDYLVELGLTREEVRDSMRAAFEAAVQAALDDGTLTEAQAEMALEMRGRGRFGGRGGHGGPGHFGRGGERPDGAFQGEFQGRPFGNGNAAPQNGGDDA